jgi:hypothetical protein
MKLTKSQLKQVIKEELQKEIFGLGDSKGGVEELGKDFESLASDLQEHFRDFEYDGREENRQDLIDAAESFGYLQVLCLKLRDVVESGDEAGKYLPVLQAMMRIWKGR